MTALVAQENLAMLHRTLGWEEARAVKLTAAAVLEFINSSDRDAAALEIAKKYEVPGLSYKSLARKAKLFEESGHDLMSLVDKRSLRKRDAGGLALNQAFVDFWQSLCLDNRRKIAPAYRALLQRLRHGDVIPGYGDWRDVYAMEHGGMRPAPDMACPYNYGGLVPMGWTERNLRRIEPDVFALEAAHKGMMAAQMKALPDVIRTRVGLKPCQVVQIDDMWYEQKVAFAGNRHAQRVVEFAMMDVLTGHVVCRLAKPVREREDGTRETLRSEWTRYLIAYLLCDAGIPEEGVLIMGEHGTASADNALLETLAQATGGRVSFGAGGMLSVPLANGLYKGRPKGNPRYKGLLEGFHALIKNELGCVRGNVGGGRGAEPEEVYGQDQADERLRAICRALEGSRPGLIDRLSLPYISYYDFCAIVEKAYNEIESTPVHDLEGWEECGFITGEYRLGPREPWTGVESMATWPQAKQLAFKSLMKTGEIDYRTRRMSRSEAWNSRTGELKTLDPVVATLVMGPELARACVCSPMLQLHFKDPTTLADCKVAGILAGGGTLTRGEVYKVWVNPLTPGKAYVADLQGRFLGVARVQEAATYGDEKAVERQLGLRQQALAEERRRLQPALARRMREENAIAAHNLAVLGIGDPAKAVAVREAVAVESRVADMSLTDADFAPTPSNVGSEQLNDDDFI